MANYLSIGMLAIAVLLLIGHFMDIKKSQK
jgi:hypothetical protein